MQQRLHEHARSALEHFSYASVAIGFAAVGGLGGLSGSLFWRVDIAGTPHLLRRWPDSIPDARIDAAHAYVRLAAANGFSRVPLPVESRGAGALLHHRGGRWELCPLLPGAAIPAGEQHQEHVARGAVALASLHLATRGSGDGSGARRTPDSIVTRSARVAEAMREPPHATRDAGVIGVLGGEAQADALARSIRTLLPVLAGELASVAGLTTRVQSVHGDARREHLLFERGEVMGVVDFGAVTVDSPMLDLARWLGEIAPDDPEGWRAGVEAYHHVRALDASDRLLLPALARSGAVLSACNWLRWVQEGGHSADPRGAAGRIKEIASRVELLATGRHAAVALPGAE